MSLLQSPCELTWSLDAPDAWWLIPWICTTRESGSLDSSRYTNWDLVRCVDSVCSGAALNSSPPCSTIHCFLTNLYAPTTARAPPHIWRHISGVLESGQVLQLSLLVSYEFYHLWSSLKAVKDFALSAPSNQEQGCTFLRTFPLFHLFLVFRIVELFHASKAKRSVFIKMCATNSCGTQLFMYKDACKMLMQ